MNLNIDLWFVFICQFVKGHKTLISSSEPVQSSEFCSVWSACDDPQWSEEIWTSFINEFWCEMTSLLHVRVNICGNISNNRDIDPGPGRSTLLTKSHWLHYVLTPRFCAGLSKATYSHLYINALMEAACWAAHQEQFVCWCFSVNMSHLEYLLKNQTNCQ